MLLFHKQTFAVHTLSSASSMLLNFPLVRLSDNIKASINPLFTPCPAKGGIKCAASPIIVMGSGRLLSKTYLREIFVSLTLQKMMSNESILCSVRPNRKIFSEKINDTISVLKIYLRLVFPFIRCFKTYSKMQCTIIIGVSKINYLGEMPLAGFHCIAEKSRMTAYLWLMNIGLYIESTCFFNFRVGNKFSYL